MKKRNNIGKFFVAMILVLSILTVATPMNTKADDYQPQAADTYMGIYFSESYLEVDDTFNATIYLDPGSATITAWYVWNLTYVWDRLGIVNCTGIHVYGWWGATGFADSGDWDNTTGNITGPQSFSVAGTTDNLTAFAANFTAMYPGIMYLNFSADGKYSSTGVQIADAGGPESNTTLNQSIRIYPKSASSFTATAYNYTAINLTWATDSGIDYITIVGNTTGYPGNPGAGELLYNYTVNNCSYNHTGLTNCTTWYYRAWGYNSTTGIHSYLNDSAVATTNCFTNISFTGAVPTNGSTSANCSYDIAVNTTLLNSKGRTCSYWINCSDGSSTSGTGVNASIGLTMSGLSHNTTYWWNITAAEGAAYGSDDYSSVMYTFTTGQGGGTAPAGSNSYPNGLTSMNISDLVFAVKVTDADLDPTNVSFFWANGTYIGYQNMTFSGNTATTTFSSYDLDYNTTYQWYALLNDTSGCGDSTTYPSSGYFSFTTDEILVHVTKEWMVFPNNTLCVWVNASNVGEVNLTNGYINDTYEYDKVTPVYTNQTVSGIDAGRYNISYLNMSGYEDNTYYMVTYYNLTGPLANGTTIDNTVSAIFNGSTINTATFNDTPTLCYYATKEANMSTTQWNTTSVTFWINITNCGDFYLNWVRLNESYFENLSYFSSNYAPNQTNETFNITQIAPGDTNYTWIIMNTSYAFGIDIENGTKMYNNISIHANETIGETNFTMYIYSGAMTEMIKVVYTTTYYDVIGTSDQVFTILGVALMIFAIMTVVWAMYSYRRDSW